MYGSTAHVHGDDIIYVETWKLLEAPYARPRARRSSSVSDMEATTIQISSLTDLFPRFFISVPPTPLNPGSRTTVIVHFN